MIDEIPTLTRKEREKLFRRSEILNAASRLFAEKGFQHTTLDEIAEASEFGKGTLYNYFQNKDDIYSAIIERIFEDYLSLVRLCYDETDTFKEFITLMTTKIFEYCVENKYTILLMIRVRTQLMDNDIILKSVKTKEIQEELHKLYTARVNQSIRRKEIGSIEPDSLVALYRSMIFPYLHHLLHCSSGKEVDIKKESKFVLDIFFNGILIKKDR